MLDKVKVPVYYSKSYHVPIAVTIVN
jgi:hypothetical protein